MGRHHAHNTRARIMGTIAVLVIASTAMADDDDGIRRIGVEFGPLAHSNQGRGGNYLDGDTNLTISFGDPTKLKRIESIVKIDGIRTPIDRNNLIGVYGTNRLGSGSNGLADEITTYLGPTSYATPTPAPGSTVVLIGAGLCALRRRRSRS